MQSPFCSGQRLLMAVTSTYLSIDRMTNMESPSDPSGHEDLNTIIARYSTPSPRSAPKPVTRSTMAQSNSIKTTHSLNRSAPFTGSAPINHARSVLGGEYARPTRPVPLSARSLSVSEDRHLPKSQALRRIEAVRKSSMSTSYWSAPTFSTEFVEKWSEKGHVRSQSALGYAPPGRKGIRLDIHSSLCKARRSLSSRRTSDSRLPIEQRARPLPASKRELPTKALQSTLNRPASLHRPGRSFSSFSNNDVGSQRPITFPQSPSSSRGKHYSPSSRRTPSVNSPTDVWTEVGDSEKTPLPMKRIRPSKRSEVGSQVFFPEVAADEKWSPSSIVVGDIIESTSVPDPEMQHYDTSELNDHDIVEISTKTTSDTIEEESVYDTFQQSTTPSEHNFDPIEPRIVMEPVRDVLVRAKVRDALHQQHELRHAGRSRSIANTDGAIVNLVQETPRKLSMSTITPLHTLVPPHPPIQIGAKCIVESSNVHNGLPSPPESPVSLSGLPTPRNEAQLGIAQAKTIYSQIPTGAAPKSMSVLGISNVHTSISQEPESPKSAPYVPQSPRRTPCRAKREILQPTLPIDIETQTVLQSSSNKSSFSPISAVRRMFCAFAWSLITSDGNRRNTKSTDSSVTVKKPHPGSRYLSQDPRAPSIIYLSAANNSNYAPAPSPGPKALAQRNHRRPVETTRSTETAQSERAITGHCWGCVRSISEYSSVSVASIDEGLGLSVMRADCVYEKSVWSRCWS